MTLGVSLLFAETRTVPEKSEALGAKVILKNGDGYFVLSDNSCWKAIYFSKRWRSVSEWWNDVKLIPENYECTPNDWTLGTPLELYPKWENLEVDEANAANQETLKQCTHLLVNSRTGQVLFAIALQPAECMIQLYNDAYKDGYNNAYDDGYNAGHRDGHKVGYREGYNAGYTNGSNARVRPRN